MSPSKPGKVKEAHGMQLVGFFTRVMARNMEERFRVPTQQPLRGGVDIPGRSFYG
jgi:hypothetical protein